MSKSQYQLYTESRDKMFNDIKIAQIKKLESQRFLAIEKWRAEGGSEDTFNSYVSEIDRQIEIFTDALR